MKNENGTTQELDKMVDLLKRKIVNLTFKLADAKEENELKNVDYVIYMLLLHRMNGNKFDRISRQELLELCPRFETVEEISPILKTLTGDELWDYNNNDLMIDWKAMGADSILGIGDDI